MRPFPDRLLALLGLLALTAQPASAKVLSSVAEALRLPDRECVRPRPFDFTGDALTEDPRWWFFRDETGGTEIHSRRSGTNRLVRGSVMRITGEMTVEKNGVRRFWSDTAVRVRDGQPQLPVETTVSEILNGNMDFRFVRVCGVISAVIPDEVDNSVCWATLRTAGGNIFLTLHGKWNDTNALRTRIDAEVAVTGFASPIPGLRQNLGRRIAIGPHDDIVLVKRPPEDPFDAPDLTDTMQPHRQRVRGVVVAVEPTRFFMETDAGRILPVSPIAESRSHATSFGDLVTAVGFSVPDLFRLQLTDALVRTDGHASALSDTARPRTLKSLFVGENGLSRIDSDADRTFIAIDGTVQTISPEEIQVSDGLHAISLDLPTLALHGISRPDDGSHVAARGLCLTEFENARTPTIYPTFKRFALVPRGKADFTVIADPPWWTPFRLTLLAASLAAILLGSALWNILLKHKAERRGKELYAEKIDHALAEQKVEERTRLAVELHDSISQTLTGIALQLDGGEIGAAKAMLTSCRGELRRCLWDLRSRTFEEKDLTEAVTRTIAPHLNGCTAFVRFNVPRENLSESLTHAILRIIRELVVNAIRHGRAHHVKIAGEMHGETVAFAVRDDGCGFAPATAPGPEQGHFGLLGIRERVEGYSGTFTIDTAPGRGTRIAITMETSMTHEQ